MSHVSTKDFFRSLNGMEYVDHQEFRKDILAEFKKNLAHFPPGFDFAELVESEIEDGWILADAQGKITINI